MPRLWRCRQWWGNWNSLKILSVFIFHNQIQWCENLWINDNERSSKVVQFFSSLVPEPRHVKFFQNRAELYATPSQFCNLGIIPSSKYTFLRKNTFVVEIIVNFLEKPSKEKVVAQIKDNALQCSFLLYSYFKIYFLLTLFGLSFVTYCGHQLNKDTYFFYLQHIREVWRRHWRTLLMIHGDLTWQPYMGGGILQEYISEVISYM